MTQPEDLNPEQWNELLNEVIGEAKATGLFDGLNPSDFKVAAEIAKKQILGQITDDQARKMLDRWNSQPSRKFTDLEDGVQLVTADEALDQWEEVTANWINVTDKVKAALYEAGHAGFADGFIEVAISPDPPVMDKPCLALKGKPWFDVDRLDDSERDVIYRAIELAAESEGVKWLPKE